MKTVSLIAVFAAASLLVTAAALYTPDKPRAELEKIYAADSGFTSVLGLLLHIRDTGPREAPAVILLHGFGSSLQTWNDWQPALAHNHRVISLDLPGFGLTGPDASGDYSDARALAVLLALMDQLRISKAAFIGNSLGGKLAWLMAATHPERVSALVLISPDGYASPGFDYNKPPEVPLAMRLLPYVLPSFMLRPSLASAFANPARLTPALYTRYRDMMLAPGVRRAIVARLAQVLLLPPEPLLRRITAPTLLLWGEQDGMIPVTNAADYATAIPNAKLVTLPNLGHVPQEEAPELTLKPVAAFLAG
jgi:pimeloyl-ACP methyl ester carboxylesterase